MNKLFKMLPLFALVLGIGAALAGNLPSRDLANTTKAFKVDHWEDITGEELGEDYLCQSATTICTQELNPMGQVVSQVSGRYEAIPQ